MSLRLGDIAEALGARLHGDAELRIARLAPLETAGVKAAIAWRQGYQHIMASSHTVVTGGPCTSDCTKLPYKRLRRPIFPLDPVAGV